MDARGRRVAPICLWVALLGVLAGCSTQVVGTPDPGGVRVAALESDPVLAFIPPSGSRIGSATASSAGGRQGWTWNGTIGCWNPYAVVIHFVDPAPLATTTAAVAVAASKAGWTAAPITPDQHTEGILGSWTKTYRHRYGADLTLSAVFVKNVAVSFYLTGAIGAAQHAC